MNPTADMFFECSWEVCNKVGGIFTVVSSKAASMMNYYKDNFFLVGPYFEAQAQGIFDEKDIPEVLKSAFEDLKDHGIICRFGNWLVKGSPNTILIDFSGFINQNFAIKSKFWEDFQVDSLGTEFHDFDEPIVWSTACGKLLEAVHHHNSTKKIVVQFHEWLSGGGVLYLKQKNVKVGTVFTTHATMLGRTIAGLGKDLYGLLDKIDPKKEAKEHKVMSKYSMEKACANNADVFTTVSEITGIEATHLLGKKPDVLLPNGLDIGKFPTFEESSIGHKRLKTKFINFISGYFLPYQKFDPTKTLFFFLASRYEIHAKGIDVFIDALSKLNESMKQEKTDKTVVAFLFVPAGNHGTRDDVMTNHSNFVNIYEEIFDRREDIINKLITDVVQQKEMNTCNIFVDNDMIALRTMLKRFASKGNPPLSTHNLDNNEIIDMLKKANLTNKAEDKVKFIFFPVYLTGSDGLLDTDYYESILASHLGVFPSYYEPWGYTPLEAGALGIASVTTDLSGFGRYIKDKLPKKNPGIYVIDRHEKDDAYVVQELSKLFLKYVNFSKDERIENKIQARAVAGLADWKTLADNYIQAHNLAVERKKI